MQFDLQTIIAVVGPAVAVYAAIRADMAAMKVHIGHLNREVFKQKGPNL